MISRYRYFDRSQRTSDRDFGVSGRRAGDEHVPCSFDVFEKSEYGMVWAGVEEKALLTRYLYAFLACKRHVRCLFLFSGRMKNAQ